MHSKDLDPPRSGLASNPVLYGVASGLARLFPLVQPPYPSTRSGPEAEQPRAQAKPPTVPPAE